MGRVRDGGGWGHGLCPPCTSTNAVSVFSLSLSRACTPASTRHPGLSHAGGPAEDDGPLRLFPLRRGHQHAALPPTRLPHHRLLLPSPLGPQCLGRGEPVETVPCPRLPPQNANTTPPADPHHHLTLRIPEANAGPCQPGRLVCSCIKLSHVLPFTPVFLLVFFSSPSSPPPPHPLVSAQVNGSPSPPSWITSSRHVSFSFLFVCV